MSGTVWVARGRTLDHGFAGHDCCASDDPVLGSSLFYGEEHVMQGEHRAPSFRRRTSALGQRSRLKPAVARPRRCAAVQNLLCFDVWGIDVENGAAMSTKEEQVCT